MYDYRFVKIKTKQGLGKVKIEKDYHEIIEEYASLGWRLVQIFAPPIDGPGLAPYVELIFEKERSAGDSSSFTFQKIEE
ncbi:MAG: DUF4177 domain-containing protein [Acidobacteriota bacterium]